MIPDTTVVTVDPAQIPAGCGCAYTWSWAGSGGVVRNGPVLACTADHSPRPARETKGVPVTNEGTWLTWAGLKSWAEEAGVPDDAVVTNQDDERARHVAFMVAGQAGAGSPPLLVLARAGRAVPSVCLMCGCHVSAGGIKS